MTLKGSNQVETIVYVEGPDDCLIFRHIALLNIANVLIVQPCGGRNNLFELWEMYKQHETEIKPKVLFFADQDLYVFSEIPDDKLGINFTNGYAIENDLFEDGEKDILGSFSVAELARFNRLRESVTLWYAYEVNVTLNGNAEGGKYSGNLMNEKIIPKGSDVIAPEFLTERGYTPAPLDLQEKIRNNFVKLIRGKMIFELLLVIIKSRENDLLGKGVSKDELWRTCITKGVRTEGSNCRRIKSILGTGK